MKPALAESDALLEERSSPWGKFCRPIKRSRRSSPSLSALPPMEQLIDGLAGLPSIRSASLVNFPPLSVLSTNVGVLLDGKPSPRPGEEPQVQYWIISREYFRTHPFARRQGFYGPGQR
jgi:hypothetical protein